MNTVINFRTDSKTKKAAQKIAHEMGLSLSDILKVYLKQFVRTKKLEISVADIPWEVEKRWIEEEKKAFGDISKNLKRTKNK